MLRTSPAARTLTPAQVAHIVKEQRERWRKTRREPIVTCIELDVAILRATARVTGRPEDEVLDLTEPEMRDIVNLTLDKLRSEPVHAGFLTWARECQRLASKDVVSWLDATDRFYLAQIEQVELAPDEVAERLAAEARIEWEHAAAERVAARDASLLSQIRTPAELTPLPAHERLVLSEDRERATLDGKTFRLRGNGPGELLAALIAAKGATVSATRLEDQAGRPKRIYDALPPEIRALVERPGRGSIGYRLRNPV